ncbi:MAG: hypothetical protein ABSA72_13250 [Nitrososphaerales archaeon]|jgi:hypothetical protein
MSDEPKNAVGYIVTAGGRKIYCDVIIIGVKNREYAYHEIGKPPVLSKLPFYDVKEYSELGP